MEHQTKRPYETVFIVNATLDDAQIDHVIDRFKEFLAKQGAEAQTIENWGRKRLAYPIQKKNNGFYVWCEFMAPYDVVQKLERYYSLEENIMRFLTIQLSDKALRARQEKAEADKNESQGDAGAAKSSRPQDSSSQDKSTP